MKAKPKRQVTESWMDCAFRLMRLTKAKELIIRTDSGPGLSIRAKEGATTVETGNEPPAPVWKTLWRARLEVGTTKHEFLFREKDDFHEAGKTAGKLLEASPAANMVGAVIVAVERVAHLWN